jgi:hypothetical protein
MCVRGDGGGGGGGVNECVHISFIIFFAFEICRGNDSWEYHVGCATLYESSTINMILPQMEKNHEGRQTLCSE